MDSLSSSSTSSERKTRSQEVLTTTTTTVVTAEDNNNDVKVSATEDTLHSHRNDSNNSVINRKTFSTLKEENDKLRTYLGLVKMCNNSAINKIKTSIQEAIETINSGADSPIDSVVKQLSIIQNEIMNMQSMHTQLEEGIEAFHIVDNTIVAKPTDDPTAGDYNKDSVIVMTTRHDVPRKTTGVRKAKPNKTTIKMKANKEALMSTKLLNRVVDSKSLALRGVTTFVDSHTIDVCTTEDREAVANIDNSSGEERENVAQEVSPLSELRAKVTKRPYISEEFKSSHLQRLVEAKRRREEMNRQLEREGKRKPKPKRAEEQRRSGSEFGKTSPKKRQIKKKTVGKSLKKKLQSQPITTTQSIVVPISQSTLDSFGGQTIQIIASGGTQILCRNDGTFIPANSAQWQTSNTQWTSADGTNSFTSTQWT